MILPVLISHPKPRTPKTSVLIRSLLETQVIVKNNLMSKPSITFWIGMSRYYRY